MGQTIRDPECSARIRALAIPPAWRDVWICPDTQGHLQATGIDAAGRKQYLYHPQWRSRRDRDKFDRMLAFAAALPMLRSRAAADLALDGMPRDRVLGCAVRLLDRGFFRIGGEGYVKENDTYGLATMQRRHVTLAEGGAVLFDYQAKGGVQRIQAVVDPDVYTVVMELKRSRGVGPELLRYQRGRTWVDVRSSDINEYIRDGTQGDFTAKDFRTWNATVLAATSLAVYGQRARSKTARKRIVSLAIGEVARYLGNTPAVCRASYVDPRVVDRFNAGVTIGGVIGRLGEDPAALGAQAPIEEAVLALLEDRLDDPVILIQTG